MKPLQLANNENELMCCGLSWNRSGECFGGRVLKYCINFEEIPTRAVCYSEEQRNKVMMFSIIIVNYCIIIVIIINAYFIYIV